MLYAALVISALRVKMEDHAQPVYMYSLVMLFLFRLYVVYRDGQGHIAKAFLHFLYLLFACKKLCVSIMGITSQ